MRILPPAYHLGKSRLLYLGRLLVHGPPELLGVITSSRNSYLCDNCIHSWLASLRQEIIRISAHCPVLGAFVDLSLLDLLNLMDFRMKVTSNPWSDKVKIVSENILDEWKYSP